MNTFILLVSLMLNLGTILAVVILYLRQNRLSEVEKRQGKNMREAEELFSAYLLEMKEENEALIKRLQTSESVSGAEMPRPYVPKDINSDTLLKNSPVKQDDIISGNESGSQQLNEPADQGKEEPYIPLNGKTYAYKTVSAAYKQSKELLENGGQAEEGAERVKMPSGNNGPQKEPAAGYPEGIMHKVSLFTGDEKKVLDDPDEPIYMKSLVNQVQLMKKMGLSAEEIARKLNKGQTEIELILKFRKQT